MVIWLLQVIKIGNHSYETHPPSAQERLHVFTKSQEGCIEVAQVHQRAVVKVIAHILPRQCSRRFHAYLCSVIIVLLQRSSLVNGQSAVSQVPRSQALQQPHQVAQRLSSGKLPEQT